MKQSNNYWEMECLPSTHPFYVSLVFWRFISLWDWIISDARQTQQLFNNGLHFLGLRVGIIYYQKLNRTETQAAQRSPNMFPILQFRYSRPGETALLCEFSKKIYISNLLSILIKLHWVVMVEGEVPGQEVTQVSHIMSTWFIYLWLSSFEHLNKKKLLNHLTTLNNFLSTISLASRPPLLNH